MLKKLVCLGVLVGTVGIASIGVANAKDKPEMIVRPDARGHLVTIPKARTFEGCVRGGMRMGYPRVGPGGESDRRGAVGYCHSIGL